MPESGSQPPAPAAPQGTLLGFDFGEQRIGIAVGETIVRTAQPLETIRSPKNDDRFGRIGQLIAEWQPAALVVGKPLAVDGSEHEMTRRSQRFANQLRGRFRLPVFEFDERFTSADAGSRLAEIGITGRNAKQHLDALAAQLILQGFLDAH